MAIKEKKEKCVTFWVEKEVISTFDNLYHEKSHFMRECIKRAIEDRNFYFDIIMNKGDKGNGNDTKK